jgi:hypothetical protein
MILALPWKEVREHRAIWITMVLMTLAMGIGLAKIVAIENPVGAVVVQALTILGMAATYGVVCGAMMLAGEHEGGTLVFLDVFLGRRGLLWIAKFLIGIVLALAQGLTVGAILYALNDDPPIWIARLIGLFDFHAVAFPAHARGPHPELWLFVLPVITLEAYAWGLLGSALQRKVLAAAAVAVAAATPVWLVSAAAPPPVFLGIRLTVGIAILLISGCVFVMQSREASAGPPPKPEESPDPRARFYAMWEEMQRENARLDRDPSPRRRGWDTAEPVRPIVLEEETPPIEAVPYPNGRAAPVATAAARRRAIHVQAAGSPSEALWWLSVRQGWVIFLVLIAACLVIGLAIPSQGTLLWPFATLLLGVACGTATFAAEQRDLSYQFLAAEHLPLPTIWRFKVGLWFAVAVFAALILAGSGALVVVGNYALGVLANRPNPPAIALRFGTLYDLLGPTQFYGVWLLYGFVAGQVFVWLCRKTILALLLATMVAAGAVALWLPSMICRGMGGWQMWLPPIAALVSGRLLVRAWAGGRIQERRPIAALLGCVLGILAFAGVNFTWRAFEVPDVGEQLDPIEFRTNLPLAQANTAGQKIQDAVSLIDQAGEPWRVPIADLVRMPAGMVEAPPGDGQVASLLHLPACGKMAARLVIVAREQQQAGKPGPAFDRLAEMLAMSRSLRVKALLVSYRTGVDIEAGGLGELESVLTTGKPNRALLRRALDELNRHAAETLPPRDCAQSECYRATGVLANPVMWTFAGRDRALNGVPERWLAGGIAMSLEIPWEDERKTRLWQAVWAGLFRGIETPYWELPATEERIAGSDTTRNILAGWLPATSGPGASLTRARLARLLDASWVSDERLFTSVAALRSLATRSRYRVDSNRIAVALALYQAENGRAAGKLQDLVPKYLMELPIDPYSGGSFRYRVSTGEQIEGLGAVRAGQGIVWSTGPDRTDHGAQAHGGHVPEEDAQWTRGNLDLITRVPYRP